MVALIINIPLRFTSTSITNVANVAHKFSKIVLRSDLSETMEADAYQTYLYPLGNLF